MRRPGPHWVLGVVAATCYVLVAITQWRRLESPSWDLAIFTQLAKAYGSLEAPIVPIKGPGFNLLGDHFHPILVLLGPVYALAPSGLTLLVVQALLIGLSAVPLTGLAIRRLGRRPGLLLGAVYVLSYGIQGAARTQFHEISFALPLLAFGLAALLDRRWRAAALWLAPLVFVKEDLGLMVVVLGLVTWRRGAVRAGLGLALWGAVWFLLATAVVLPALNPRGQYDYTDNLAIGDLVGAPLDALAQLLGPGEKVVTVLLLIGMAGVVGVRSPLLLAALPTLAWRFLGDVPFYWSWLWHYDAVLMPLAVAALLDALGERSGAQRVADGEGDGDGEGPLSADLAEASAPAMSRAPDERSPLARLVHHPRRRVWGALGAAALTVVLTAPDLPVVRLLSAETWRVPPRAATAQQVVQSIPEGSVVASDIALLAYLVPTTTVLWSGTPDNPVPDYFVIDRRGNTWGGNPPSDAAAYAQDRHPGTSYELVLDQDGYQVARLLTD